MTLYSEARLTRVMDGPTGTPIETYGFNDPSGSTRYCYNRFGDLTRKVQTTNGMPLVTAYGYDSAGRLATTTYPDGAVQDAGINRRSIGSESLIFAPPDSRVTGINQGSVRVE